MAWIGHWPVPVPIYSFLCMYLHTQFMYLYLCSFLFEYPYHYPRHGYIPHSYQGTNTRTCTHNPYPAMYPNLIVHIHVSKAWYPLYKLVLIFRYKYVYPYSYSTQFVGTRTSPYSHALVAGTNTCAQVPHFGTCTQYPIPT